MLKPLQSGSLSAATPAAQAWSPIPINITSTPIAISQSTFFLKQLVNSANRSLHKRTR